MKFLISVIDDLSGSGTPEEMSAIDSFNESLREKSYWFFAGGLIDPTTAVVIDNRNGADIFMDGPLFAAKENVSGFWIIDVPNKEVAERLAFEASNACNRKVELREFFN
jgi:hypothetical protein